ncbi:hypothetical protein DPX16_6705 [Anabarilius grahami]|uniref:Uncharacterized protein n=1 Tax=Anabarilius grahami TaxID=495550 RepID=A0A3N0YF29_ANAGA|nr:hypothetical protein DPX16_6705 [Anabarilius grahami]
MSSDSELCVYMARLSMPKLICSSQVVQVKAEVLCHLQEAEALHPVCSLPRVSACVLQLSRSIEPPTGRLHSPFIRQAPRTRRRLQRVPEMGDAEMRGAALSQEVVNALLLSLVEDRVENPLFNFRFWDAQLPPLSQTSTCWGLRSKVIVSVYSLPQDRDASLTDMAANAPLHRPGAYGGKETWCPSCHNAKLPAEIVAPFIPI